MNEVVVNVFFSFFWGAVVVRGHHNEVPPRGGAGVRRPIFTIIGTFFLFFWSPSLWSHSFWCKPLCKHGQKVAKSKNWLLRRGWWHQQRIDVVCNVNCMNFFNAWCVKDVEWSIIRVRWANRRLGQYAGEWSSCERFFLIFLGCRGCKEPSQRCAATRGCGGTEAHFYTRGRNYFFFV